MGGAGGYSILHLIASGLIGFAIGVWLARRRAGGEEARPRARVPAGVGVGALPLDAATRARVEQLIAEDCLIEAIREVRAATGQGLKEAKDLVDGLKERVRSGGARAPDQ